MGIWPVDFNSSTHYIHCFNVRRSALAPDPISWNFRYLRYIKYANPRAVPKGNQGSDLVGQRTFLFDIFFSRPHNSVTIRAGKRETWSTTYTPRTIYDGDCTPYTEYHIYFWEHIPLSLTFESMIRSVGHFYSTRTNHKPIITDQRSVVRWSLCANNAIGPIIKNSPLYPVVVPMMTLSLSLTNA